MRTAKTVPLLFGLLAIGTAIVWWIIQGRNPPLSLPPPDGQAEAGAPLAAGPPPAPLGNDDDARRSAATAPRATPAAPSSRLPADLADHVTAWLQVLDASTGAPVPAAAAYRFSSTDEAAIAYSDARGIVPLPLQKAGQLIVVRAGYLMRLVPTQPGSTADVPQLVQLEPDRYCSRCVFRFRLPDGAAASQVYVRFRPQRGDTSDQAMPAAVRDGSESVQRAWREQRTLAAVRAVPELHVQLGHANATFVHQLAGDDEVAFVETGLFELDAATTDGFVARALFDTADVARDPLTVRLRPGREIRGVVRGAGDQGIEGALLAIAGSDPLRLSTRSDRRGAFSIGPLADGVYGLVVRHRDYEVARPGPLTAGSDDVVIALTELPKTSLRGRVFDAGPGRTPLAGARATVIDPVGQPISVETDAEGFFALRASGTESLKLNIAADGYLPHAEFVDPGASAIEIELWSRSVDLRRQQGLAATIRGVVLDAQGRPLAGIGVRFVPDQSPDWLPGRRVISGGMTALPRMTTSGSDGSFELETASPGPGTVALVAGASGGPGVRVLVTLGKTNDNVRLTARRGP